MRLRAFLVVAGIATLAAATPARPASAAVFTVNTTADNASANCQGTGPCSLRGAITEGNRLSGADTINVPAGNYTLNSQNLGDLPISSDITIKGASAATTTIGGDGKNARIFRVFSAGGQATISHLRLTFASVVSLPTVADRIGGIILVDSGAALSLDHVRADNGQAVRGGGIAIRGGTADIAKSSIDNNHASQDGAGILNLGLAGAPAKLTLTDSTVASNTNGTASGVQSTGNTGNVVTVTRSTIAYNNAGSNGGTGLRNETGTLSVAGSILVENRGDGTPDNCGGTITNGGGNVENFNKCGFALHDVDNTSQQLLASMPVVSFETPVLPIPATSVAVNLAGACTGADQRDLPRPQGLGCDAGAYEFDLAPDTSIDSGPTGTIAVNTASFTFSSPEPGVGFECKLDAAAFASCTSPRSFSGLADSAHTFQVRAVDTTGHTDATPASRAFSVDTTPPDTNITNGPSGPTASTSATFTFTSTEANSTFQCSLDNAAFGACPAGYTGLAQGAHNFRVRATDALGNTDQTPASRDWTVDTVAPDTNITNGPSGPTATTSATFTFTSTEANSTFQCSLDNAAFGACPVGYTGLSQGAHNFRVRATDALGNTDQTPASRDWIVDTVAPDTNITNGPSGSVSSTSATFTFTSTEANSTFQCSLDNAAFAACPTGYTGLAQGAHNFRVRAIDQAGNTDSTPASRDWNVDTVAPDTSITNGPSGPTASTSAAFTFTATETVPTFQCSLDGAAFGSCPVGYTGLSQGAHSFQVRAVDAAGNTDQTPATANWTVDTVAPDTNITNGPSGLTASTSATFTFTSTEANSTFQCSLDNAAFAACPTGYTGLAQGAHNFRVRAIDAAGNQDATPATANWTVDTIAPDTAINSGPNGPINVTSAAFTFGSTEAGSTFQCQMDTGGFTTCPANYTNLSQGAHTFSVRATDTAGNTDATPATRGFTVDTTPPALTLDSGPTGLIQVATATFTFNAHDATATVLCALDGAALAACTSPKTYTSLGEGFHTFRVRATDPAGNQANITQGFTVDTTAPDTDIVEGPSGPTRDTNPSFTFTSNTANSTFECKLGGPGGPGAFATCTSPRTYAGLAPGAYTFSVRAIDPAGNPDPAPATMAFTVDTTAPTTTIDGGPAGPINHDPTFTFHASEDGELDCALDDGNFAPCASPKTYGDLAEHEGDHEFRVRAIDAAGNVGDSVAREFSIDTTDPPAEVVSGPAGPTTDPSPAFAFDSAETGSTFACRLDGPGAAVGAFGPCTSPTGFNGLQPGDYVFFVRATDPAGNATTTSRAFSVTTVQQATPTPTPTVTPAQEPTPVPNQSVVIQPVSGKTLVKLPGSNKFEPVDVTRGIPNGSTVDTRKSKIKLFAIPKAGKPAESALFYQGIFKLKLSGGVTELQLVEELSCPKAGKADASAKKPKTRKLWGDGSGSFRTRGQYSAATVRGTQWLVQDTCTTTLTQVKKGVVEVQDFVKKKKILVRAPKKYTARKKR